MHNQRIKSCTELIISLIVVQLAGSDREELYVTTGRVELAGPSRECHPSVQRELALEVRCFWSLQVRSLTQHLHVSCIMSSTSMYGDSDERPTSLHHCASTCRNNDLSPRTHATCPPLPTVADPDQLHRPPPHVHEPDAHAVLEHRVLRDIGAPQALSWAQPAGPRIFLQTNGTVKDCGQKWQNRRQVSIPREYISPRGQLIHCLRQSLASRQLHGSQRLLPKLLGLCHTPYCNRLNVSIIYCMYISPFDGGRITVLHT